MSEVIQIDGSDGEGGGQILRTSLGLSVITGNSVRIFNIRKNRSRPGLLRQHLTAVRAAAAISCARVEGDQIGSVDLLFEPQGIQHGTYRFAIGSAGSVTLLLQTILPPLLMAMGTSEILLEGGTHNPLAPSFDFLSQAFIPLLKRMGAQVDLHLERPGYFPAGGGLLRAVIRGGCKLDPLVIEERGEPRGRSAWASVAGLPRHIGDREIKALLQRFDLNRDQVRVEEQDPDWGPGNVLQMRLDYANVTEVFTGYGQKGRRAERIAQDVLQEVRRYLKSNAPIGEHLADQIMLPLALAGGGRYRTLQPSLHTRTQATMIGKFLDVPITFKAESEVCWLVCIGP